MFFRSFPPLLRAQNLPIEQWKASTVDQIDANGDRLYLYAQENTSIPDKETLSLNYMPNVARWSIESNNSNDMPVGVQTNASPRGYK